jgi:hypothetical protein
LVSSPSTPRRRSSTRLRCTMPWVPAAH